MEESSDEKRAMKAIKKIYQLSRVNDRDKDFKIRKLKDEVGYWLKVYIDDTDRVEWLYAPRGNIIIGVEVDGKKYTV